MLLLPFFHVYSVNLLIFHQFVLYSSILMTILTKKHPHTRFSAPFQGVNDHDVYLAIKKKKKKKKTPYDLCIYEAIQYSAINCTFS